MAKCDVFVCTSSVEGFSTAATEALLVGIPVVTTPVAGMRELLGKSCECGFITDGSEESICDRIQKMIDHPEFLKHYKEKAYSRGKKFSKGQTVKAVEDMLQEL